MYHGFNWIRRHVVTIAAVSLLAACGGEENNATENNAAENNAAENNASTNNGASNNGTSNNSTANNASTNNTSANNTSTNNTSTNNTSANNTSTNNTSTNNTSANNTSANNTSTNNTSANNTSTGCGEGELELTEAPDAFNEAGCYATCTVETDCGEGKTCRVLMIDGAPVDVCLADDPAAPACNVDEAASGLGPVAMCSEIEATACFGNADCQSSERCEDIGGGVQVPCCVEGPRGCKRTGDLCDSDLACEEGVCIARNDQPSRCSQRCMGDEDCPAAVPECNPVLGYCVTASE